MFGKEKKGINERDIIVTYGVDEDGLKIVENPTREQLEQIDKEIKNKEKNGEKVTFRIDSKNK